MKNTFILFVLLLNIKIVLAVDLSTTAAKTDFKETGRYEEVVRLCRGYAKAYPKQVVCEKFGVTPEGRDMLALVLRNLGRPKNPVVFFQGGIHAGEIDGKDAGFLVVEETLTKKKNRLDKVTLVFVPIFNIDGHERFGKYNRPNQVGPEKMGWRTTAQNLNLNRDFMKAEAPEMRSLLKYLAKWDPIAFLDLHVTDGADFQHDISVNVNPSLKGFGAIQKQGLLISDNLMKGLEAKGSLPLPFYPSFVKDDEPLSGFEAGIAPPRFSQSYWGLHNRYGFLVETHSWKPYKVRVLATKNALDEVIGMVEREGSSWLAAARSADLESAHLAGNKVVLHWEASKKSKTIDFLGYHYEISQSKISKQPKIKCFPEQKETWKVPFFDELEESLAVVAPKGGYIIPPAHAEWVSEKLKVHGVDFRKIKGSSEQKVEVFKVKEVEFGKTSYEGRLPLKVKGEWKIENRLIPPGSLFVPITQRLALVALHLFEPQAVDSLLAWGFFNAHFERKEYMENYVAEGVAEEMLKDPEIKLAFDEELKNETIAKSPEKRLEFFYRRHPSWDSKFSEYPVFRTDQLLNDR